MLEYDWDNSVGHWVCTTAHAMRRALTIRLAQEGITLRQWEVLACLSANSEASQSEMAERMGIEPHTMAGVLARMERDGWLERTCCTEDRRRNRIHPTAKAEAIWNRAVQWCHDVRAQASAGLPAEELAQFKRTCERIHDNLSSAIPPAPVGGLPLKDEQAAVAARRPALEAPSGSSPATRRFPSDSPAVR